MQGEIFDLTGLPNFGHWEVLERLPGYPTKYRCRCRCGKEKIVQHGNLQSGRSAGCGVDCPLRHVGRRLGPWEVLESVDRAQFLYRMRCVGCGRERISRLWGISHVPGQNHCRQCAPPRHWRSAPPLLKIAGVGYAYYQCAEILGVSRQRIFQLRDRKKLKPRMEAALERLRLAMSSQDIPQEMERALSSC